MIHQPLAGSEGTAKEILIHAKEFLRTKDTLNQLLAKHTGQPLEAIEKDTDRDNFMSATRGPRVRADRQGAGADAGRDARRQPPVAIE